MANASSLYEAFPQSLEFVDYDAAARDDVILNRASRYVP
jgi:hypothetical protein